MLHIFLPLTRGNIAGQCLCAALFWQSLAISSYYKQPQDFVFHLILLSIQADLSDGWHDGLGTLLACMQVAENFTSAKDGKVPNV